MSEGLRSSSIPTKVSGTLSVTIFRCFSFKMPLNSPMSSMLWNPSRKMKFLKVKALTIISGISLGFNLNVRYIIVHPVSYILTDYLLAAHMVLWAMSDRGKYIHCGLLLFFCHPETFFIGIPRSFRMMQGFGVNTYTLINAEGKRVFVKFHMTPELGVHSLVWDEALKIAGQDPGKIPW